MLDCRPSAGFLVTEDADMAMGRQESEQQPEFWVPTAALPQSPGHPFYEQLNQVLAAAGFDRVFGGGRRPVLETHQAVCGWGLRRLAEHELLKGRTLGIDGSTLEANAAMRSIVRRE